MTTTRKSAAAAARRKKRTTNPGAQRIMPKGQKLPLPAQARVRIGKPMTPKPGEGSREFTTRVEKAVRTLAETPKADDLQGTWIERWRGSKPRELVYGDD